MNAYIILTALIIALLSLTAMLAICICCRRMEQEKNHNIVLRIREQDRTAKELEHARIEKQALEKVLETALSQADGTARTAGPCNPDTVRTNDETRK